MDNFKWSNSCYAMGEGNMYRLENLGSLNNSGPPSYVSYPMSFEDPVTQLAVDYNFSHIAFGSRYDGVLGGYYAQGNWGNNSSFVRKIHDEGIQFSSKFFYDRLGRLIVSQNSRQLEEEKFSYTLYDELGRVYEVGEKSENDPNLGACPEFKSIFGTFVGQNWIPTVIDDFKLSLWVQNPQGTRSQVTKSYYDRTHADILAQLPNNFAPNELTQRKRIVHVTYEETFDYNDATYDHATHYDYDIHGNVITLLQDNKSIENDVDIAWHRFKRMDYVFDLVSGNVHRMDYQTGNSDQWHHAYSYDADNRITDVYTTTSTPYSDGMNVAMLQSEPDLSTYWDKEANYQYYDHGPLARTELGEEKVQGIDYAYTLQGWLKGINSNSLESTTDIGRDADPNGPNALVAKDVASFSLHYFNGDYSAIDAANNNFIATLSSGNLYSNSSILYNGNIGRMITTITDPNLNTSGERDVLAMGNTYRYDQLQRLKRSESFTGLDIANNTWGTSQSGGHYVNEFTFDANGNIETQKRYGEGASDLIDDLTYKYNVVNGQKLENRLYHLNDTESASSWTDDLDDQNASGVSHTNGLTANTTGNYRYDKEGRLVKDIQEGIDSIIWRVDGKVKKIQRPSGSAKKNVTFEYDAMGNRIAKHTYDSYDVLEKSSYYILDAQGNTISVYEREVDNTQQTVTYAQAEKHIYGSSRLGVLNTVVPMLATQNQTYSQANWTHSIGERTYEISNHLGNVLSVISDKPIPHVTGSTIDYYMADLRRSQDYSPFGVTLEGRGAALVGAESYRYGYQGSEKDDEVKSGGNSYTTYFRQLDPRVGRWLSIDPKFYLLPWHSPYVSMGNNPITSNDVMGDVFDPESQKTIDNHKDKTAVRIKGVESEIQYLKEQIASRTAKGKEATSAQSRKMENLNQTITEYTNALNEISILEKSEHLYSVNKVPAGYFTTGQGGKTHYDKNSGAVVADYSDESTLAHELKHIYQFQMGELSFDIESGNSGYLYDANDEIEAYRRQSFYDDDLTIRNMTASEVRLRHSVYAELTNGPLGKTSSIEEIMRGRGAEYDKYLEDLGPEKAAVSYGEVEHLFGEYIIK